MRPFAAADSPIHGETGAVPLPPGPWRHLTFNGVTLEAHRSVARAPRNRLWNPWKASGTPRRSPASAGGGTATPAGLIRILDGVNLTIDLDGITVVVGASGSGKSSLLRLANRLSAPTAGTVTLDGVDLALVDPLGLRRRVGMVFQAPVLFAGSVADNLAVATPDLDRRAAARALARCGLDPELLDREADQLSGGEAQRMCTARTLLTDPRVVLMDEVTSSLDPAARAYTEALAHQLASEGIAVVWVTHDLDQACRLSDRIVVLDTGRVLTGAAAEAYLADGPATAGGVPPTQRDGEA